MVINFEINFDFSSPEEIAREAIKHASKALRKGHLVEEGVRAPAIVALAKPIISQANALCEDMIVRLKASGLEKLAWQQVDGVVRGSEDGAEFFVESTVPSACKYKINANPYCLNPILAN